jgi:hypothetical protein
MFEEIDRILHNGLIKHCSDHQKTGTCTCCEFTDKLGNWISLAPYEKLYLQTKSENSDTNWEFIDVDGISGIKCRRHGFRCNIKPIDCKMYPFFPTKIEEKTDYYVIEIAAGFPKCPLGEDYGFRRGSNLYRSHLWRVSECAILLHNNGYGKWLQDTSTNLKGYEESCIVKFPRKIDVIW